MKHLFLGIILSLFTFSSYAQDYYWVGGSGDWSEYATHWATASGGTTFHTQEPTSTNNVFFDANSFSASGQVITTSGTINCHDMDWSGTTNSPTFNRLDVNTLNVSGSITLAANATYNISKVILISDEIGKTLDFKGDRLVGANVIIIGNGEWNLQSSILSKNIYFQSGTLNTNDFDINVTFNFYLQSTGAKVFNMGSSFITTPGWRVNGSNITLNAGTSTITSKSFLGDGTGSGSFNYYNLHLLASSYGYFKSSASFNEITIDPGAQLELEPGATFTANNIIANGDKFNPITMYSTSTGTEATFNVASGTINASYLILTDVHATGGATFNADQSVDNGNNTGWNITPITSQDYYWVGNGGNWNEVAHWATTSGGSTKHTSYPGQLDNVFFDNNSFNVNNQEVIINIPAQCNNMDWTGASNNPKVMADTGNPINVYGAAIFTNGVSKEVRFLNMMSDANGNTLTSGNNGIIHYIKFIGRGEWTLQDSISCNGFQIRNGTVNLNDQPIYATNSFSMFPEASDHITLNMGNSHVYSNQFVVSDFTPSVITINSGTSTIELSGNTTFDGEGLTFNNVIFNSGMSSITSGNNTFANLTLKPGVQLTMPANRYQTITGDLIINGTSVEPISVKSSIDGTQATFSKATGTVEGNYVTLQDNTATGGATFNARASIDNGNNTGWNFIKLAQTIAFDAIGAKTTLDPTFDLTATASSGLALTYISSNEAVATISGSTVTIIGAGTTTITASQSGNGDYEPAPNAQQVLTVTKTSQTITFSPLVSKTIGDPAFDLTATASSGLAVTYTSSDEAVATISGSTVTIIGAGTTTITASQSGNGDYEPAADAQQVLTVTVIKADQSIIFDGLAAKTFGDANFELTATASSGLAVTYVSSDLNVATISGRTVTIIGAGTSTITASQVGDGSTNPAPNVEQVLTVNKAQQVITFESIADKLTTDADFDVVASATSGLTLSYAITGPASISGTTVSLNGEGMVVITASQMGDDNYNSAADVDVSFLITAALVDQTITFGSLATKTFGDEDFDLTATASSNLSVTYSSSDETVATITGSTVTIIGAGTSTITASQAGDETYNSATSVQQTLTVNKADQTISLEAIADKLTTDAAFDVVTSSSAGLTVTLSIAGPASLAGTTITLDGTEGTVTLTATQLGNANYNEATEVSVSFAITTPALSDQIITFDAIEDQLIENGSLTLIASASSELAITYEVISGPATLNGNVVTFTGLGMVTIKALQAGNSEFAPATPVEQTFEIVTVTALEVGKTTSISFYPNPAQNAVHIKGAYQALKIININGGVVYQSMEQKNRIDISQLISGNYIMLISTKNGTETHKLVKK